MKALTVKEFSPEVHRSMKVQAAKEGITMRELIEKAIAQYIEKYEKEQKKGK